MGIPADGRVEVPLRRRPRRGSPHLSISMAFQPDLQALPGPNFNPLFGSQIQRRPGDRDPGGPSTAEGRTRLFLRGCPLLPAVPPCPQRPVPLSPALGAWDGGAWCLVLQTRKRIDLGGKLQQPPDGRRGQAGDSRMWAHEQRLQGRPRQGAQASLRRAYVRSPRQLGSPTSTVPVPPRAGHFLRAGHWGFTPACATGGPAPAAG